MHGQVGSNKKGWLLPALKVVVPIICTPSSGVLSFSPPFLDSTGPPPPCAPEVVLKSPPVWEEKSLSS